MFFENQTICEPWNASRSVSIFAVVFLHFLRPPPRKTSQARTLLLAFPHFVGRRGRRWGFCSTAGATARTIGARRPTGERDRTGDHLRLDPGAAGARLFSALQDLAGNLLSGDNFWARRRGEAIFGTLPVAGEVCSRLRKLWVTAMLYLMRRILFRSEMGLDAY